MKPPFTNFELMDSYSLETISARNISARVILAWMFHHGNILARAPFGPADFPSQERFDMGTFWQEEFSAQEHFGSGTFWYMDILAQ
jgi:hypothetical protein